MNQDRIRLRSLAASVGLIVGLVTAGPAAAVSLSKFQHMEVEKKDDRTIDDLTMHILERLIDDLDQIDPEAVRVLNNRYVVHLIGRDEQTTAAVAWRLSDVLHFRADLGPTYFLKPGSWVGLTTLDLDQLSQHVYDLLSVPAVDPNVAPEYPDAFLQDLCEYIILAPRPG